MHRSLGKALKLCYFQAMSTLLSATLTAPRSMADAMLNLTDTFSGLSLDVGEDSSNTDNYRYTFFLAPDAKPELLTALRGIVDATPSFDEVDTSIDYIARNRELFPPLIIGPYFIARNDEEAPEGLIKLDIMPNRAFGSGEHATTTGCLLGYLWLKEQGKTFTKGLDFGAGSGILAIAAAKRDSTPFVCVDNDAPSVEINAQNGALNGVADLLQCAEGDVPPHGPFELVFANILLQPLLDLSAGLVACTEHGGSLILSGFTTDQAAQIEARYGSLGMAKVWQHVQGDWVAQIWQHA